MTKADAKAAYVILQCDPRVETPWSIFSHADNRKH
jgi:hypothetical protein